MFLAVQLKSIITQRIKGEKNKNCIIGDSNLRAFQTYLFLHRKLDKSNHREDPRKECPPRPHHRYIRMRYIPI